MRVDYLGDPLFDTLTLLSVDVYVDVIYQIKCLYVGVYAI